MNKRAPANENNKQDEQARLIPLFDRTASPRRPGQSSLFRDRVFQPPGQDYYFIALPAPRLSDYERYLPVARRLLEEHWSDQGDVKGDVLRAVVTILHLHVPEYAAAAAMEANDKDLPELMPAVVIQVGDGQTINIGRPRKGHGVACSSFDRESALSWVYEIDEVDYGLRREKIAAENQRYRRVDRECDALYDTSHENYMMKPVEEILATILAASEDSRARIFNVISPDHRKGLPRGPLRVKDPAP